MATIPICLVVCDGSVGTPPMVICTYYGAQAHTLAQAHSRTITGASVLCMEAHNQFVESFIDDMTIETDSLEWDDIDTPVDDCEIDDRSFVKAMADRSKLPPT